MAVAAAVVVVPLVVAAAVALASVDFGTESEVPQCLDVGPNVLDALYTDVVDMVVHLALLHIHDMLELDRQNQHNCTTLVLHDSG